MGYFYRPSPQSTTIRALLKAIMRYSRDKEAGHSAVAELVGLSNLKTSDH